MAPSGWTFLAYLAKEEELIFASGRFGLPALAVERRAPRETRFTTLNNELQTLSTALSTPFWPSSWRPFCFPSSDTSTRFDGFF